MTSLLIMCSRIILQLVEFGLQAVQQLEALGLDLDVDQHSTPPPTVTSQS